MTLNLTSAGETVPDLGGFDLAILDTLTLSEAGVDMPVVHPKTLKPLVRPDGIPVTIKLCGTNSEAYRETTRQITLRRNELNSRGVVLDGEHFRAENVEILVACTRDWNFDILDGKPFPYSATNARKFWSDRRFEIVFKDALSFVMADSNFLAA